MLVEEEGFFHLFCGFSANCFFYFEGALTPFILFGHVVGAVCPFYHNFSVASDFEALTGGSACLAGLGHQRGNWGLGGLGICCCCCWICLIACSACCFICCCCCVCFVVVFPCCCCCWALSICACRSAMTLLRLSMVCWYCVSFACSCCITVERESTCACRRATSCLLPQPVATIPPQMIAPAMNTLFIASVFWFRQLS